MLLKYCTRQTLRAAVLLMRQLPKPRDRITTEPPSSTRSMCAVSSGDSGSSVRLITCAGVAGPLRSIASCNSLTSAGTFIAPTGSSRARRVVAACSRARAPTTGGIGAASR